MKKLTETEARVYDMVRRATRAGGALTLPQIRERLGNNLSGHVSRIAHKLAAEKLVVMYSDEDFDGTVSLRTPKGEARV